jgi:hypothetical protein
MWAAWIVGVDFQLVGMLIVVVVAIPYVIEIVQQVPLLTRMVSALPPDVRAALPRHPSDPRRAVFGSARFFLALFRYALRLNPADPAELAVMKKKMRASVFREAVFGGALIATVAILWRHGWRPPWPGSGP